MRRLKNLFPNYEPAISTAEDGISFSLRDSEGREVTKAIKIYRHHKTALRAASLRQRVESNRT
jgi:hypothetical protein